MADLVPVGANALTAGDGMMDRARGLAGQPAVRRMLPWFLGAAGVGLAALTWSMLSPAPQRMLYASLGDAERAEVAAALDQAGITYAIDSGTGAVTVAEDELYRARMLVAQQGALAMPETGTEMIDSLPMGASRTLEGDRLRAAQERELELTIMEIDGVEAVRVHLAKADRSVFVRENGDPTASVMLRLVRGKQLTAEQVRAIANLVAASVVGLSPEAVRIVDQQGDLLSDASDPNADLLDLQARNEAKLREQLAQLLTPIVGAGNFSTEVQVELDMDEQTAARESYDDEGRVRSETTSATNTTEQNAGGIPGATTNTPPVDPTAEQRAPTGGEAGGGAAANGASNASRVYELGREVSVTSSRPGQLARLSVAVAINEEAIKNPQELARIKALVAAAVGSNAARGDTVEVMSRSFSPLEVEEPQIWETPWFATILRNVVALISVLLVLLLAVRPLLKAVNKRLNPEKPAAAEDADGEDADDEATAAIQLEATPPPPVPADLADQIELARRITREQPEDALQALRRMLREEPASDATEAA